MENSNNNIQKHALDFVQASPSGDGPSGTLDQCPVSSGWRRRGSASGHMTVVYDSTPLFPVRKIFPKHQRVEYFNCQIYEKKQQTKHPYKLPNSAVVYR